MVEPGSPWRWPSFWVTLSLPSLTQAFRNLKGKDRIRLILLSGKTRDLTLEQAWS
jgi:hypothetical protein